MVEIKISLVRFLFRVTVSHMFFRCTILTRGQPPRNIYPKDYTQPRFGRTVHEKHKGN
jgi:hypothetical protein